MSAQPNQNKETLISEHAGIEACLWQEDEDFEEEYVHDTGQSNELETAAGELDPSPEISSKEQERVNRRLMRQLISEDQAEARKSGELIEAATSKGKKGKKEGRTKDLAIPTKHSSDSIVRCRICDETKRHNKPKGPILCRRGGPDALEALIETARKSLSIRCKKPLYAYVDGATTNLLRTSDLADDCLIVFSLTPMQEPSAREAQSGGTETSHTAGNAQADAENAQKSQTSAALDAVRAAYAERASGKNNCRRRAQTQQEIEDLSARLARRFASYENEDKYKPMRDTRENLPASKVRADFLRVVQRNQVVIVAGETGSGKTTQCPNFILEDAEEAGRGGQTSIICTQPRRIAAIGVAERVAQERGEHIGNVVGYAVRLDTRTSRDTRLLFCTSGVLMQRLNSSPHLDGVTHVVIDEAHERSLHTDFLLIILRELLPKRPDLKLILMSATLEQALFQQYFASAAGNRAGQVPTINISGRTHPVSIRYLRDAQAALRGGAAPGGEAKQTSTSAAVDHELQAWLKDTRTRSTGVEVNVSPMVTGKPDFRLIADLCATILSGQAGPEGTSEPDDGAVLIFLPGHVEIERCVGALRSHRRVGDRAYILPLHGSMPVQHQHRVFKKPPEGKRKIVVATNIAETSITIEDVTHVIDSGHVREMRYNPSSAMSVFSTCWVSQASGKQRAGRAGRIRAGACWRLCDQAFFENQLPKATLCEMRRTALEELILQLRLLELGGSDPGEFLQRAPEPPARSAVVCAVQTLVQIGALGKSDDLPLTPLGFHLAHMPVDARTGKMLIYGALCRCLAPILTIAACVAHKTPFSRGFNQMKEDQQRSQREANFGHLYSDHLAVVSAYDSYMKMKKNQDQRSIKDFCDSFGLTSVTLDFMTHLRQQFLRHLIETGFADAEGEDGGEYVNTYKANDKLVRCVLCAGLFPNVVQVQHLSAHGAPKAVLVTKDGERCAAHPSSINARHLQEFAPHHGWLLYHSKVKTSQIFVSETTLIGPIPMLMFGGELRVNKARSHVMVDGLLFDAKAEATAVLFKMLRREIDRLLLLKVANPSADFTETAAPLLLTVNKLLELEDFKTTGLIPAKDRFS